MMNRRRMMATLGGIAGGILHPGGSVFAQPPTPTPTTTPPPSAKKCQPGTVSLKEYYTTPLNSDAAEAVLFKVFTQGVALRNPSLSIDPVRDHLKKSYAETLKLKFSNFQGGTVNPIWALLVDHTFIMGQLTVSLRKGPQSLSLRPHDVLRAQAKFSEATSSTTCECFIPKHYELPVARLGELPSSRKGLCEDGSGEIDNDCPLC